MAERRVSYAEAIKPDWRLSEMVDAIARGERTTSVAARFGTTSQGVSHFKRRNAERIAARRAEIEAGAK